MPDSPVARVRDPVFRAKRLPVHAGQTGLGQTVDVGGVKRPGGAESADADGQADGDERRPHRRTGATAQQPVREHDGAGGEQGQAKENADGEQTAGVQPHECVQRH